MKISQIKINENCYYVPTDVDEIAIKFSYRDQSRRINAVTLHRVEWWQNNIYSISMIEMRTPGGDIVFVYLREIESLQLVCENKGE